MLVYIPTTFWAPYADPVSKHKKGAFWNDCITKVRATVAMQAVATVTVATCYWSRMTSSWLPALSGQSQGSSMAWIQNVHFLRYDPCHLCKVTYVTITETRTTVLGRGSMTCRLRWDTNEICSQPFCTRAKTRKHRLWANADTQWNTDSQPWTNTLQLLDLIP